MERLANRVILNYCDEFDRFWKVYCLGEQDNLSGEKTNKGPVVK